MKILLTLFVLVTFLTVTEAQGLLKSASSLPPLPATLSGKTPDWLLKPGVFKAGVFKGKTNNDLVISNGLVERHFRLSPNVACYSFKNLVNGEEMLRALKPEASLVIDGKDFNIGGLQGQFEYGYIETEWLDLFKVGASDFTFDGFLIKPISARFEWAPKRWIAAHNWPPRGIEVIFHYSSSLYPGIKPEVHYEIYEGLPLISKWLEVKNESSSSITIQSFHNENLAVVEPVAHTETIGYWDKPNMLVLSDYAFGGMNSKTSNQTTFWVRDSIYTSQVDYGLNTPCQLICKPPVGPDPTLKPGERLESFRVFELLYDSDDLERKGLATRKMYRTLAPWALENPIFLHLTSTDPSVIHEAIQQCAETGFEMIILSFGSGLNMESTDPEYISKMKGLVAEANQKGIELGGYSLLASRRINDEEDVINPATGKTGGAIFGNSPCLGSEWGIDYFKNLKNFIDQTGFALLEHDGSYPGDKCASLTHPGHKGLADSQWNQWKSITEFYNYCRSKDIYLNVPDWYFLSGSNKSAIGYRETNWSLPRDRQIMLGRQNLYDGTWEKTPSMGWTFVPLVEYQGGGAEATLEPLSEHLKEYEAHLAQNFGAGVQACYRGFRLYDKEATKTLVKEWVTWYKKYRLILNSDIIHLRRADGRDWDGFMHVDPSLEEKGLLMVFNPLEEPIQRTIKVPLYYSGIKEIARVREKEGIPNTYKTDHNGDIWLEINIPAHGFSWFVIE
ncbi:MAG: alpha-galactosidase [Bacteroidales bacterium]|nr:alpha-galactosidase [Bacteroidales bacterium]